MQKYQVAFIDSQTSAESTAQNSCHELNNESESASETKISELKGVTLKNGLTPILKQRQSTQPIKNNWENKREVKKATNTRHNDASDKESNLKVETMHLKPKSDDILYHMKLKLKFT